ncbi:ribonuclease III [Micromonospora ureilytica]|uniref:Ribonuclease 3 n=1 Tax=Micromonospora ureilytica TaxID=709868 RepID=A0ABS0JK42_9ACTN|nr:ribonuclease III [Micromonospora ureilytica]MBG6067430.1 ribonuclease-3 [Micromonospora ureilytica]WSG30725.1 ribonuclease III [Micromonospora ureilytica]WSR59108.1 ribonuclease III [Micromonospora ureilytica]
MSNDKRRRASVGHLEAAFGVSLEPELLQRALTHRSYAYENGGLPTNERLEFLGDSVLGVVITTALFHNHPDLPEGQLAKLRASVVNMRALADVARGLGPDGLGAYLLLGKGEETTGGRDKASILADTLEALLGAIYLQYGLDTTGIVIHRLFDPLMAESAGRGAALDWKTSLQELTAALGLGVPEYRIEGTGPDHLKTFTAWVVVAGNRYGGAEGRSKKEAEQRAAEAAWRTLAEQNGQNGDDGQNGRAGDDRRDQPTGRDDSGDRDEPFGPLERAERAAQAEQADHLAQALPAGGADGHETGPRRA